MPDGMGLTLEIRDNSEKAIQGLNGLAASLEKIKSAVSSGFKLSGVSKQIEKLTTSLTNAVPEDSIKRLEGLANVLERLKNIGPIKIKVSSGAQKLLAMQSIANEAGGGFGAMESNMRHAEQEISVSTGNVIEKLKSMGAGIKKSAQESLNMQPAANSFKSAIVGLFGPIANLGSAFLRIAKYRFLRTVIKEITEGFKTGIENLLGYSRAIGSSFAADMDSATNALLKMKNSIGAAVAPALQALIPILQAIVGWVIAAANVINQFLSLLTGKSHWTRAKDVTAGAAKSVGGVGKAAKEASEEIKGLLADFDELNIIQQENNRNPSGRSGRGGAGGIDYSDMFEEVSKFDSKIRQVVLWLKKHWEEILEITKLIGAAILAWKLSSAFGGVIGSLLALASSGLIIAVVWKMSSLFNGEYLRTGNPGWLIADVLTTYVGAFWAKKVLGNILEGTAGKIAFSLAFLVSAAAGITALIKSTDVSALSEEAIIASIENAAKAGIGVGYGFFTIGKAGLANSIIAGAGAALITFGVATGIKAMVDAVSADDFNEETLKAMAISSLTIGGGVALIGYASKMPILGAASAGLGASALVVGVSMGIKAITEAVDSGYKVPDITDTAIASLATGLGAGAIAIAAGAGIGLAGVIGGAAGIATIGVIFGLTALLGSKQDKVQWADKNLTEKQIDDFVNGEMFSVHVKSTIAIINDSIDTSDVTKQDIEQKLIESLGTFNVIKLGLASEQDYSDLNTTINGEGGMVETIQKYIDEAKKAGKLTLQFTPELVGGNEKDASEWFGNYTTGWDKVNEFVKAKGAEIGKLLTTEEGRKIIESEPEIIAALMQQLSDVSNAIAKAEIGAEAFAGFKIGLGDMSKASVNDAIKAYNDYKSELRESYEALVTEQYAKQGELVAALYAIDPNSKEYEKAKADYEEMGRNLVAAVDSAVNDASRKGSEMIASLIRERYAEKLKNFSFPKGGYIDAAKLFGAGADDAEEYAKSFYRALRTNLYVHGGIREEWLSALSDKQVWDILPESSKNAITKQLEDVFGKEAAKNIIIGFGEEIENELEDTIKESTNTATEAVSPLQSIIEYDPIIDDSESSVEVETEVSSPTGNPFAESIKMLEGNVDLYNRKLIEAKKLIEAGWEDVGDADQYATLFSQTYSAGDLSKGYDWKMDKNVGIVATPILPDGRVLSPQQLETYLDSIVSRSTNAQELKANDTLGLIVGLGEISGDLDEAYRAIDEWAERVHEKQAEIYDTKAQEEFVKNAEKTANIDAGAIQAMYENIAKQIDESADLGEDFWVGVNASIVEGMKAFGLDEGTAQQIADDFKFDLDQAIIAGEWDTTAASALEILKQAIENNIPDELKAPNTEAFNNAMTSAANTTVSAAQTAINAIQQWMAAASALGGMSGFSAPVPRMSGIAMAAEGGIMTTGQMFIAREAGPEYVGTMNGRTAVANNDQIVSGVASGVAAGQAEQNALLRQQNDYLRQLLAKESTVKIVPSSALGRVNMQSAEMYARQTGG